MTPATARTMALPHRALRRGGAAALLLALTLATACGGGGVPEVPVEPGPSFTTDVAVSPTSAYWGTAGARFVISGGANLVGQAFTVRLGTTTCTSATADAADPSQLDVVCDIPLGGETNGLTFRVEHQGQIISGDPARLAIALAWPPADGPASFAGAGLSPTSHPTWWERPARLEVTGGVNLPGHALTALMDGVPCSAVAVSPRDPGTLELSCPTRPGGAGTSARLAIQEGGATLQGGELVLDLDECQDSSPPPAGVRVPRLCSAPAGTTAHASSGLEGIWGDRRALSFALFAPDGRFIAADSLVGWCGGAWSASGATWTPSNAERQRYPDFEPFTSVGAWLPFTSVGSLATGPYLNANAAAVTQTGGNGSVSVAGAWGHSDASLSFTVDATGAFTGATTGLYYGECTLAGALTVIEPPRNMLAVALTISGGEACHLWQSSPLTGLGFIDLETIATPAGVGHRYSLWLLTRSAGEHYGLLSAFRP